METKSSAPFWDDTFLQEVETKAIAAGALIWSLSGPSFALRTPAAMIYLDPYLGGDPPPGASGMYRTTSVPLDPARIRLADAVLISHDHYDHCHAETLLPLLANTTATFYGPASVVRAMRSFGVPGERIVEVKPGECLAIKDANITVYPGNDPGEPLAVCYHIAAGGVRLLFTGDSMAWPGMDALAGKVDIAMMAFGRSWYMSEGDLLSTVARLQPRLLLPYHWELWRGHTGDPLKLGQLIAERRPMFATELLLVGDYLHYLPDGQYVRGI
jgi:L-ascorbate 6-phosphate lactonase